MSDINSRFSITPVLLAVLALFGCSSGGGPGVAAPLYSGSTTPAAITSANAEAMGRGATEGVNEAVNLTAAGEGIPLAIDVSSSNDALAQKVKDIALKAVDSSNSLNLPVAAVLTADDLNAGSAAAYFCGGSVTVPDNIDQNAALNFSMTFNNLCFDDGITSLIMSGTLVFTETQANISITFSNFSVNIDGMQESFSGIFSCDTTLSNCTISTDFAASDGSVYRITDVVIVDTGIGHDISATFYHHDLGRVTIATNTEITYGGGCGVFPNGGEIEITGTGGSWMTVTFNSDCTFTIQGSDGGSSFGPGDLAWQ